MTTDVLTLAVALVAFVAGLLIAMLYAGARSRSLREAHTARVNGLQSEATARERELTELRATLATRTQEAETRAAELRALQSDHGIQTAQLHEVQSEMGSVEDRLNAAEARLLTADAQLADRGREVDEWGRAYSLLRTTHDTVLVEHGEAEERRRHLEDDLQAQRLELAELGARLEALQSAAALQAYPESGEPSTLQQRVTAISLLKATAEAGLRRRELELSEVRSQLSALRYSINVLTSSAAELAALAGGAVFGIEGDASLAAEGEPPAARRMPALPPARPAAVQAEELAGLEGMIADWFAELRSELPYAPGVLRAFAGATPSSAAMPATLPAQVDANASAEEPAAPPAPIAQELPPALMLAAIKAAATTSLERSVNRQYALAQQLAESQVEYDGLVTRIQAWRSMLHLTLQNEPELLYLLDKQSDETAGAAALLSSCATVALMAYQQKQEALRRLDRRPPAAALPESASESRLSLPVPAAAEASQVGTWAPVALPPTQFATPSARFRRRNR